MKEIPLTQGKVAIVDDDDYEYLIQWKWYYNKDSKGKSGYAQRNKYVGGKQITIKMHRVINNTPSGFETDHINGNKLDNRKSNLRTVSTQENQRNRTNLQSNNKSGKSGVSWHPKGKKWQANVGNNKKNIYLGLHTTKELAAKAVQDYKNKQWKQIELKIF